MLGGKRVQKKPPSVRGSRPSFCWSGSFFSTCLRRLFFDPFCVVGCPKKNLGSGGAGVAFSGQARLFSDLSGIVPCQTYGFPLDLAPWASSVRRLFLDPFCV